MFSISKHDGFERELVEVSDIIENYSKEKNVQRAYIIFNESETQHSWKKIHRLVNKRTKLSLDGYGVHVFFEIEGVGRFHDVLVFNKNIDAKESKFAFYKSFPCDGEDRARTVLRNLKDRIEEVWEEESTPSGDNVGDALEFALNTTVNMSFRSVVKEKTKKSLMITERWFGAFVVARKMFAVNDVTGPHNHHLFHWGILFTFMKQPGEIEFILCELSLDQRFKDIFPFMCGDCIKIKNVRKSKDGKSFEIKDFQMICEEHKANSPEDRKEGVKELFDYLKNYSVIDYHFLFGKSKDGSDELAPWTLDDIKYACCSCHPKYDVVDKGVQIFEKRSLTERAQQTPAHFFQEFNMKTGQKRFVNYSNIQEGEENKLSEEYLKYLEKYNNEIRERKRDSKNYHAFQQNEKKLYASEIDVVGLSRYDPPFNQINRGIYRFKTGYHCQSWCFEVLRLLEAEEEFLKRVFGSSMEGNHKNVVKMLGSFFESTSFKMKSVKSKFIIF